MRMLLFAIAITLAAAPPTITELQPRGAQKGRPFLLTIAGTNLTEGPAVLSSLPANFTAVSSEKPGYATFLVEPTADWPVGTYPVRLQAANGLSNILLLSIGAFPELVEEESRPGSLPHQNDTIERAQTLPSSPITINGKLMGPERDVYRLQIKAGERRVFEVDARRAGSAIDPVIHVYDAAGKRIARSEDDPTIGLDARLDLSFPKDGFYYVEIFDARFSAQAQNFYRFKTGAYQYPTGIYPLGGRRGEQVELTLSNTKIKADLTNTKLNQISVNLPDSPSLPLAFAVGDYPELSEPVTTPFTLPITINGRLANPGEIDKYELPVEPGEELIFELQARELGTSKLTGLIVVSDESGKRLAAAGDAPLPVDVAAVQASSRTLGDPLLLFKVPVGVQRITVSVEDLAKRGGTHYAYRLTAKRAAYDLRATIVTPFLNIPAGGTAIVAIDVERRGFMGPLKVEPVNLPAGLTVSGGDLAADIPDPLIRTMNRRANLSLTAAKELKLSGTELGFRVVGDKIERAATGLGYLIAVNGASTQGVVDRQRALNGLALGYQLPTATTAAEPATLTLSLDKTEQKEAGFEYRFRWRWTLTNSMQPLPDTVNVDVPNLQSNRVIEVEVDKKDKTTGTFLLTTSKNSLAGLYSIGISGRLMVGEMPLDIFSPLLRLDVPELQTDETKTNATNTPPR